MNAQPLLPVTPLPRTLLFVPGDRSDRFYKALDSGADGVVIDLEDAVNPADKPLARQNLKDLLDSKNNSKVFVRINAANSSYYADDLSLLKHPQIAGILLPKAETAESIRALHDYSGKNVWPIIETALGVIAIPEISKTNGVAQLAIGTIDLGLDLDLKSGTQGSQHMLEHAKFSLVLYSRAAGLPAPLDGVYPSVADRDGLQIAAEYSRASGFGGMLCIHPAQVEIIHHAFTPSQDEIAWAQQVVKLAESHKGAFSFNGQMMDAPVIERARRILGTSVLQ